MTKRLLFIFFLITYYCFGQTISFDDFISQSKNSLNIPALKEVQNSLPEDIIITSEDVGDFSGDGKNDFAVAYRYQRSRDKKIFVNLYCDSLSSYVQIFSDTLKFFELPIEIAFNISKSVCYITQKLEEKSWKIIGYSFYRNEFKLIDTYLTQVKKANKRIEFGEEDYINYSTLSSFTGFFDLNSVEQFKKTNYFIFPVYDFKRNIYSGYKHKIDIDNLWKWNGDSISTEKYGTILTTKGKDRIIIDICLDKEIVDKLNPARENAIDIYFDRSKDRYLDKASLGFGKRSPKFRNEIDDNISSFSVFFRLKGENSTRMEYQMGDNFNFTVKDKIKYEVFSDNNFHIKFIIPLSVFNLQQNDKEIGNFIALTLLKKDNSVLKLKSSEGSENDPSSYSRMLIINPHSYFGYLENYKLKFLQEKLVENGIIDNPE